MVRGTGTGLQQIQLDGTFLLSNVQPLPSSTRNGGRHSVKGIHQLNGLYTQKFNHRYRLTSHLFQGRYKAILVQKESHLLDLSRYVVLNPVRANIVEAPGDWVWSSFNHFISDLRPPSWLDTEWSLGQIDADRNHARHAFTAFVLEGIDLPSPLSSTKHQLILDDDQFVEQHQLVLKNEQLGELSITHRPCMASPLAHFSSAYPNRKEAMARAYYSGAYTMSQIADFSHVHYRTVSRAVQEFETLNHQK